MQHGCAAFELDARLRGLTARGGLGRRCGFGLGSRGSSLLLGGLDLGRCGLDGFCLGRLRGFSLDRGFSGLLLRRLVFRLLRGLRGMGRLTGHSLGSLVRFGLQTGLVDQRALLFARLHTGKTTRVCQRSGTASLTRRGKLTQRAVIEGHQATGHGAVPGRGVTGVDSASLFRHLPGDLRARRHPCGGRGVWLAGRELVDRNERHGEQQHGDDEHGDILVHQRLVSCVVPVVVPPEPAPSPAGRCRSI